LLLGCSTDPAGTSPTPDAHTEIPADTPAPDVSPGQPDIMGSDTAQPDAPDIVAPAPECTHTGFEVAKVLASTSLAAEGGFLDFSAANSLQWPTDILGIELLLDQRELGPYVLQDENYATCERCIRINAGCTAEDCERKFLAHAGNMHIQQWDDPGGAFRVVLTDLRLREVTISEKLPLTSTPVPDGETWCIDALTLEASPLEVF